MTGTSGSGMTSGSGIGSGPQVGARPETTRVPAVRGRTAPAAPGRVPAGLPVAATDPVGSGTTPAAAHLGVGEPASRPRVDGTSAAAPVTVTVRGGAARTSRPPAAPARARRAAVGRPIAGRAGATTRVRRPAGATRATGARTAVERPAATPVAAVVPPVRPRPARERRTAATPVVPPNAREATATVPGRTVPSTTVRAQGVPTAARRNRAWRRVRVWRPRPTSRRYPKASTCACSRAGSVPNCAA